jgi:hypothetical protein
VVVGGALAPWIGPPSLLSMNAFVTRNALESASIRRPTLSPVPPADGAEAVRAEPRGWFVRRPAPAHPRAK